MSNLYYKKAHLCLKYEGLLSVLLFTLFVFSITFLVLPSAAQGLLAVDYNHNSSEGKTINYFSSFNPIQIHNFGA
jgi:hypothetical protein